MPLYPRPLWFLALSHWVRTNPSWPSIVWVVEPIKHVGLNTIINIYIYIYIHISYDEHKDIHQYTYTEHLNIIQIHTWEMALGQWHGAVGAGGRQLHRAVGMGQWALGNGYGHVGDVYVSIRICMYTNKYKPYLDGNVDAYWIHWDKETSNYTLSVWTCGHAYMCT